MQGTREARVYDVGEAGRGGGCRLQKYGDVQVQEARDGAVGRDFAFAERPGRDETVALVGGMRRTGYHTDETD